PNEQDQGSERRQHREVARRLTVAGYHRLALPNSRGFCATALARLAYAWPSTTYSSVRKGGTLLAHSGRGDRRLPPSFSQLSGVASDNRCCDMAKLLVSGSSHVSQPMTPSVRCQR